MFKTRYALLAFLAVEIASIPAAFAMLGNVSLERAPQIAAAELPLNTAGVTRYLVSTDAPFAVVSSGYDGPMQVTVQMSGQIGQMVFGGASQLPGPSSSCAMPDGSSDAVIYRADRPTAASEGSASDQAVVLILQHDPAVTPSFAFVAESDAPDAAAC